MTVVREKTQMCLSLHVSRTSHRALQRVTALPRGVLAHLFFLFSRRSSVGGIELVDSSGTPAGEADHKIEEALCLLSEALSAVYRRLRRAVRHIVLLQAGGPEYWHFAKAIALTKGVVERADPDLLAMLIVHESMHARLWRMGIGYPHDMRARIEALCVAQEVRLARALPNAEELIRIAEGKLQQEWWSEAKLKQRIDRAKGALRKP